MLPSVVASELEQVACDAIRTAFHPTTMGFRGLVDRFLGEREQLLKGPYVSVALPFHEGSGHNWFPQIPLPFPPYRHQEKAFQRLLPGTPLNTLVASGTGSGKTECFLLPLLDHCREQRAQGQRGIKAILIYPMNALATDQARRIADLIHTIPALAGLRAGLYIGAADDAPTAAMTATSVITDKEALHKAPPGILLTNTSSSITCCSNPMCRASGPTTDASPMAAAPSATWWWMSSTPLMAPRAPIWPA